MGLPVKRAPGALAPLLRPFAPSENRRGARRGLLGAKLGEKRDDADDRALERVRAAQEKLKEEELGEERGDGRNEGDKGIEKRKEPQEERYEEMEREEQAERLAIERNSRDRGGGERGRGTVRDFPGRKNLGDFPISLQVKGKMNFCDAFGSQKGGDSLTKGANPKLSGPDVSES